MDNYKSHCSVCSKCCRKNQLYVICSHCLVPVHQKCSGIPPSRFECFTAPNGNNPYICNPCAKTQLYCRPSVMSNEEYYSTDDINLKFDRSNSDDIFILHVNAVSLVANFDELSRLIFDKIDCAPHIICVSETRLKNEKIDFQKNLVSIPCFDLLQVLEV